MATDKIPEMVERVAAALYTAEYGDEWSEASSYYRARFLRHARIAIKVMREPTEAMLNKAETAHEIYVPDDHEKNVWRVMIDAALGE